MTTSVEHPPQSFSQITISDEDDPHQVSQDAGLLCYAELLYRCRLCRSQNASDTLVFKHSHNFLLHLRTCHWLIVQHASATLREHDTTQESVSHQEKHSDTINIAPTSSAHNKDNRTIRCLQKSPLKRPSGSHSMSDPSDAVAKCLTSSPYTEHSQETQNQQEKLLYSLLSRSQCNNRGGDKPDINWNILYTGGSRKTRSPNPERGDHLCSTRHNTDTTQTLGESQEYNNRKRKHAGEPSETSPSAYCDDESRDEDEPIVKVIVKSEPEDEDDDNHRSVIHYKPVTDTDLVPYEGDQLDDSVSYHDNQYIEPATSAEAVEEEVADEDDCPDQHQKSLYATLRNILNTASHTANATTDARPTLYTPDGNADEYDGHSLDNSLCDSSHVSEFNKVAKLSAILKDYVTAQKGGIVSRDDLLTRMSDQNPVTVCSYWGSACNKAIRDTYPESYATRKGKFKKTFYFGIALLDLSDDCEEVQHIREKMYRPRHAEQKMHQQHQHDQQMQPERLRTGLEVKSYGMEVQTLLVALPKLMRWSGDPNSNVSRDRILDLLPFTKQNTGMWGIACNKAVRQLFPNVFIKRKGKFKTTFFYGIDLKLETEELSKDSVHSASPRVQRWLNNTTTTSVVAPPVINVRTLNEQLRLRLTSRLTATQDGTGDVQAEELFTTDPVSSLKIKQERTEDIQTDPMYATQDAIEDQHTEGQFTTNPMSRLSRMHAIQDSTYDMKTNMTEYDEAEDLSSELITDKDT